MELRGIMLAIPLSFALSVAYIAALDLAVRRFPRVVAPLVGASAVVLVVFAVEVVLLSGLGAVRSRALLGSAFDFAHLVVFFFGVPALANLVALRTGQQFSFEDQGCPPVLLCTVFSFVLIVLNYSV